jgi:hypothetical protein
MRNNRKHRIAFRLGNSGQIELYHKCSISQLWRHPWCRPNWGRSRAGPCHCEESRTLSGAQRSRRGGTTKQSPTRLRLLRSQHLHRTFLIPRPWQSRSQRPPCGVTTAAVVRPPAPLGPAKVMRDYYPAGSSGMGPPTRAGLAAPSGGVRDRGPSACLMAPFGGVTPSLRMKCARIRVRAGPVAYLHVARTVGESKYGNRKNKRGRTGRCKSDAGLQISGKEDTRRTAGCPYRIVSERQREER